MQPMALIRFLFVILIPMWIGLACGDKIEPGNTHTQPTKTLKAATAKAEANQQPLFYEAVGTIVADTGSTIASKVMGTVLKVHVREGDRIAENAPVVTLDQRQVTAQLDRAQAALKEARRAEASVLSNRKSAQAGFELAASTFQRYQRLAQENSVSKQEFEEVQTRHTQAQAALNQAEEMLSAARFKIQQAEAAVREIKVVKKYAVVRAPYSGRVISKRINVGDMASPGTPLITIEQAGRYRADLVLPENHIQSIRDNQTVQVFIPALKNLELTGQVRRIVPSADARSRSFQVKVDLPANPDLKSGMFARIRVPVGTQTALLIPQAAIRREGQLTGVFVVDDDRVAHFRLIRRGKHQGDQVQVISGLSPGDRYVTEIPLTLENGDRVEAL